MKGTFRTFLVVIRAKLGPDGCFVSSRVKTVQEVLHV